jgi:hypothetical protein
MGEAREGEGEEKERTEGLTERRHFPADAMLARDFSVTFLLR